MTYRWIFVIDCQRHKFHCDHYKLSIVQRETRSHMRKFNCSDISTEEIKRIPAPDDSEY